MYVFHDMKSPQGCLLPGVGRHTRMAANTTGSRPWTPANDDQHPSNASPSPSNGAERASGDAQRASGASQRLFRHSAARPMSENKAAQEFFCNLPNPQPNLSLMPGQITEKSLRGLVFRHWPGGRVAEQSLRCVLPTLRRVVRTLSIVVRTLRGVVQTLSIVGWSLRCVVRAFSIVVRTLSIVVRTLRGVVQALSIVGWTLRCAGRALSIARCTFSTVGW